MPSMRTSRVYQSGCSFRASQRSPPMRYDPALLNQSPPVSTKRDNRNPAGCEILLISQILIGGQQKVEASFLGNP